MAFDAKEEWRETPAFLRLHVEDGDAVYRQALKAGATSVTEMTNLFFGDRVGRVRDPRATSGGSRRTWRVDPAKMGRRAGQKEYRDAMSYFQSGLDAYMTSA